MSKTHAPHNPARYEEAMASGDMRRVLMLKAACGARRTQGAMVHFSTDQAKVDCARCANTPAYRVLAVHTPAPAVGDTVESKATGNAYTVTAVDGDRLKLATPEGLELTTPMPARGVRKPGRPAVGKLRTVRVPDATWEAAAASAEARGETVSEVIRKALELYVNAYPATIRPGVTA